MTKTTTAATASLSEVKSSTYINKQHDPCETKPYNRYNVFYILERERFLQSNYNYKRKTVPPPSNFITGYELLDMPDLPPRYENLDLPYDWHMPGKHKATKRYHTKSHGLASFKDIARHVADEYKNIDKVTLEYVTRVAAILKQRQGELKAARRRDLERIAVVDALASTSSIPTRSSSITNRVDACRDNKTKLAVEQCSTSAQSRPFVCAPALPKLSILDWSMRSASAVNIKAAARFSSSTLLGVRIPNEYVNASQVSSTQRKFTEVDIEDGDIMAMWHS